jgi:hypothetical protein
MNDKDKIVLLKATGGEIDITPGNGKNFQMDELYKLVDTDTVQILAAKDGRIMIVDEDGKRKMKIVNAKATALYQYGVVNSVVGDVIICPSKYFK